MKPSNREINESTKSHPIIEDFHDHNKLIVGENISKGKPPRRAYVASNCNIGEVRDICTPSTTITCKDKTQEEQTKEWTMKSNKLREMSTHKRGEKAEVNKTQPKR